MTLSDRIGELAHQHGSLRAAARVLQVDAGYLTRLSDGSKTRPGKELLQRMGLRQVIDYERTKTPAKLLREPIGKGPSSSPPPLIINKPRGFT